MTPPAEPAGDRDLRLDDGDDRRPFTGDHATDRPVPPGPLLFVLMFAFILIGFWLMGNGFAQDDGIMFSGGLLLAGLAYFVPLQITGR